MATQENNPGLLSKVARFVRNPTTDWADLDKADSIQDSDHGREALKLVIERKRHDDAVRKREFAQLRKLRQASPSVKAELAQGLSSFRSTSGGVDDDVKERASTLKKIDDIEAQMSRQWWKGRSGAVPLAASGTAGSAPSSPDDFPSTQSSRLSSTAQGEVTQMSGSAAFDYQSTEAGEVCLPDGEYDTLPTRRELSPTRMVSADLGPNLSDPDLEEAAIRYANGDAAGAEAALQTALQLPDAKPEMVETWAAALLDLYRSTGQSANFERMALNYTRRFGRPAPAWAIAETSMVAQASGLSQPASVRSAVRAGQRWESPVVLDEAAVARLRALVRPTESTYYLNWRPVQRMTAAAASNLADLLAAWCDMPLSLCFEGVDSLDRLLSAHTPSGDRLVPSYYWQLRFDALRVLRMQDAYELVALDFCVTFEVSPPPWREPVCQRVDGLQADGPTVPDRLASVPPPETSLAAGGSKLALSGDVLGDVSVILAQWQAAAGDASHLRVSCKRLIRVDFAAAGGLLNWAAHVSAQGGRVEFVEVPRLVCAFFNLIGINEHAHVTARTN